MMQTVRPDSFGWDDPPADRPKAPGGRDDAGQRGNRLVWLAVIGLGVLAFELTSNPALSVLIGCVKFGWDELRMARRVRRHDPDPIRRRVMARFLTAYGLWKTSIVAGIVMCSVIIGTLIIAHLSRLDVDEAEQRIFAAYLTSLVILCIGFVGAWMVALWAFASALGHRVQVWIGRRTNRAKALVLSTTFILGFPVALVIAGVSVSLMGRGDLFPLASMIGLMVILPMIFLVIRDLLERRVLARSPEECWGGPTPFDPYSHTEPPQGAVWSD